MELREVNSVLENVYSDLSKGKIDRMLGFFVENVVLEWGPFSFRGREGVRKWGGELRQMFTQLAFKLNEPSIQGNTATQSLSINITAPNGRRGLIRATADYEFEEKKIKHIKINILEGILVVRKQELPSQQ